MSKKVMQKIVSIEKQEQELESTKLSGYNIKLSLIDEIQDNLSRSFGSYDFIEDLLSDAQQNMTKARDILKFEMIAGQLDAEEGIEELERELKQLGVDEPAELKRYKSELQQLEKLINKAEQEIKSVG